ncbi:MAG TPA: molybdenum cofactor biosynthesis protein B [Myxococcales bacterium]|nr:molybdenum cofactor biosynthesis protein B [Myxococcales bacterium]HAN31386.1 molybdenum cofactor biosynthesis protein B [Myxococcales bacterium]
MSEIDPGRSFVCVGVAVLTISDTRTLQTDTSGQVLADGVNTLGHRLIERAWVTDDVEQIQATLRAWIARDDISIILTTGGTGITRRDVTPEAVSELIDKPIDGFGELFRWLSYSSVGTSTIQSRALAGVAEQTLIFALPGSSGACRDAWQGILVSQLDSRHRPCNFIELLPRL